MKDPSTHLDTVGSLAEALAGLALEPVLVGGMALVALGPRRAAPGDAEDVAFLEARLAKRRK